VFENYGLVDPYVKRTLNGSPSSFSKKEARFGSSTNEKENMRCIRTNKHNIFSKE
jgi:hypothetical protein